MYLCRECRRKRSFDIEYDKNESRRVKTAICSECNSFSSPNASEFKAVKSYCDKPYMASHIEHTKGLITTEALAGEGFTRTHDYLPDLLKNDNIPYRTFMISSEDGDYLIYWDIGNTWCRVRFDSRDYYKEIEDDL